MFKDAENMRAFLMRFLSDSPLQRYEYWYSDRVSSHSLLYQSRYLV